MMIEYKITLTISLCLLIFGNSLKQEDEEWECIINGFHPMKSCRINHSELFVMRDSDLDKLDEKVVSGSQIKCLDLEGNKIREISKNFFDKVPNVRLINLNDNQLNIDNFFQSFPNLISIETLNLSQNKPSASIKISGTYLNLRHLYLRNLGIHDIKFVFSSSSLTNLYLSNNQLSRGSTLLIPGSVTHLILNNNSLIRLPSVETAKIKVLSINDNLFELIGCSDQTIRMASLCLESHQELESLFARNNNIYNIRSDAFENSANLIRLDLSSNHINKLQPNTFDELTNLRVLNLSSNPLTEVPNLCKLENLEILVLDHTRILGIAESKFCDLKNLKELWLNDADIKRISGSMLGNLMSLEELHLENNQLSTFKNWQRPFSLRRLFLQGNHFKSINDVTTSGAAFLEYLDLRRNPIEETERRPFNISRLQINL